MFHVPEHQNAPGRSGVPFHTSRTFGTGSLAMFGSEVAKVYHYLPGYRLLWAQKNY